VPSGASCRQFGPAIEQAESALATSPGTLLLVTHDRRMLGAVKTTRPVEVADGRYEPLTPRSSECPAASRSHCGVGRPLTRHCSPVFRQNWGQPGGEFSKVS
jgi:hypothetical protein